MFHRFHQEGESPCGQGSLTNVDFETILEFVGPSSILQPEEWLARLRTGALRSDDLCITFDDGLLSQYRVALPILDGYGLKAFWFVHSSVLEGKRDYNELSQYLAARYFPTFAAYVDEFLSRLGSDTRRHLAGPAHRLFAEELRQTAPYYAEHDIAYRFARNKLLAPAEFEHVVDELLNARGLTAEEGGREMWLTDRHLELLAQGAHGIGLHSYDHPFEMAALPVAEQKLQFARNYEHLERATGKPVRSMSHPHNSYAESTLAVLSDLGIECGFRSDMVPPIGKALNPGPLEFAREDAIHLLRACR